MADKKIADDIKALKSFLEFWSKFHSIYNDIITTPRITEEDESKFLETKDMLKSKYDELKSILEFKFMPHARLTDPVGDILAIESIRFISERNLKKLNDDWKDSYIFLNNIMEHFEDKKRRLEQFNPIGVFFKRFFNGRK